MILRRVLELAFGLTIFFLKSEIAALLLIVAIGVLVLCDVAIAKGGKADSFDYGAYKPIALNVCNSDY